MRRGHGSTKVPGVKLRPAAPTKSTKSELSLKESAWSHSLNADDVDSTAILKSCRKPFIGVVVCASGLSDKANTFQQAVQLGAQTSSDLTDRVTHLICESPGSAKYNYCIEYGIPILQPSWITDAYIKWLSGETVDVIKSMSIHRFPVFKTVRLSITAINDEQKRNEIRKQLEKNGGTFIDGLRKDSQVTHLLCGPDRGENGDGRGITSKMQLVMGGGAGKVHLVWDDWFWDCLQFKGMLKENEYLATGPRPQRRVIREPSPLLAPIASSAEPKKDLPAKSKSTLESNPDVEEIANVKRVPEATARLWGNMLKGRGFEMKDGKLTRNHSEASSPMCTEDFPLLISVKEEPLRASSRAESSLNAAFKRTKSFAPTKTIGPEVPKTALQRVRSTPATTFQQATSSPAQVSSISRHSADSHIPAAERNLFVGLTFQALGAANGPKLIKALELRGGTVLTGAEGEADYIIVRLVEGSVYYRDERNEAERKKYRTECWIEQCIFEEKICNSNDHPAFVPLRASTPIPGADKMVLHISGLTASEKTPSVRLIKAIGATVTDQLSRKNTHLICPCGSGPKFNKAREWSIPVLNLEWLFSSVRAAEIQDIKDYLVNIVNAECPAKDTSMDATITDITNSEFVQGSSKGKAAKNSERTRSASASSGAVNVAAEPAFSDSWTANPLLSESAPEHPPTSSSPQASSRPGTAPTTPSPLRRHMTSDLATSKTSIATPFVSPTKPKKASLSNGRCVPSSATPSPLKMPSANTRKSDLDKRTASASPATATGTTLSGDSAIILKDAIASLLGKRPSSDDNVNDAENHNKAPGLVGLEGGVPNTRASKRSKPPPRTKSARSFSRTTSVETLGGSGFVFDFRMDPVRNGDHRTHLADSPEEELGASAIGGDKGGAAEESMRVTYEDPNQRAEERRLLSLIAGETMALDADAEVEGIPQHVEKEGVKEQGKKAQPKPRRRGRNLVRRVTKGDEQS